MSAATTDYEHVLQFTEESTSTKCPTTPQPMTRTEVEFLLKMMLSELTEMALTVTSSPEDALEFVRNCVGTDVPKPCIFKDDRELVAAQADALVDAYYYSLNAACKKGMNLSNLFKEVHRANMDKRDVATGKFLRREDGKIIKPTGWKEPDVIGALYGHNPNLGYIPKPSAVDILKIQAGLEGIKYIN